MTSHTQSPRTIAVTLIEGGVWLPFPLVGLDKKVHSILFEDGRIWDAVNGWRNEPIEKVLEEMDFLRKLFKYE